MVSLDISSYPTECCYGVDIAKFFVHVLKASYNARMLAWTWKMSIPMPYFVRPDHYLLNPS